MSRLAKFRQGVREKVLGKEEADNVADVEQTAEEVEREEEESRKNEYRLMIILEKVREIYYQRKLVGSIEISRSFLATSNSIGCDIDGTGEFEPEVPEAGKEEQKIPLLSRVTINNATRLLNRLEVRAKNYRNKSYKEDLTISGSIDITDPMGFTGVGISCSATISSLLARKAERIA